MSTTTDDARPDEIARRVEDWVRGGHATVETSQNVTVTAEARKTPTLPDTELDVQPEEWAVAVTLAFAASDEGSAAEVLTAVGSASRTVTLKSGESAEITWPDDAADAGVRRDDDAPGDNPFRAEVSVSVTVPWPNRNDATAESA